MRLRHGLRSQPSGCTLNWRRRMSWWLLTGTLLAPTAVAEVPPSAAAVALVADDPQWLALGHWTASGSGWTSDIENPDFYLSPNGRQNPGAELSTTADAMQTAAPMGKDRTPAPCAFPGRAAYLKRLGLPVASVACPEFQKFADKLAVKSATLVFASAYANNPASIFGHTVLRLNHETGVDHPPLLGNSVAFLAQIDTDDDPIAYTFKGLAGGYPGTFSVDPYYVTAAYYTSGESRDLWEYPLNLNQPEIDLLVAHLWELTQHARFAYYFFDKNCAYQLLALLAVAKPDTDLRANFRTLVLPLEVTREIHRRIGPGQPAIWRASLKTSLHQQLNQLSTADAESFRNLQAEAPSRSTETKPQVLDTYIAYLNFLRLNKQNQFPKHERLALREALIARAKLADSRPPVQLTAPLPPDSGHAPFMLRAGAGARDANSYMHLRLRPGLHDLLNADDGYESFAAISYFDLAFRSYGATRSPAIEHLTIAEVNSLVPFTWLLPAWSWRLKLGWDQVAEQGDGRELQFRAEAGGGLSFNFYSDHLVAYQLLLATVDYGSAFYRGVRGGPGSMSGLNLRMGRFHTLAEVTYRLDLFKGQNSRLISVGQSLSLARNWDLRAEWLLATDLHTTQSHRDAVLTLGAYL